ncbi:MAG: thioredoxin [Candidatus Shapirobacteria bacterium]
MSHLVGTSENFQSEVLDFKGKTLVDFWASWCGPCQMLLPIIDEIGEEQAALKVVKINVDEQNELAAKYSVISIPTILLFVNGQVKETLVGFRQKQDYLDAVDKY